MSRSDSELDYAVVLADLRRHKAQLKIDFERYWSDLGLAISAIEKLMAAERDTSSCGEET